MNTVKINIDSLADATIERVNKQKKQKVLLEQDLWRKKRDIKKIETFKFEKFIFIENFNIIRSSKSVI